jgi:hypothetical protein
MQEFTEGNGSDLLSKEHIFKGHQQESKDTDQLRTNLKSNTNKSIQAQGIYVSNLFVLKYVCVKSSVHP